MDINVKELKANLDRYLEITVNQKSLDLLKAIANYDEETETASLDYLITEVSNQGASAERNYVISRLEEIKQVLESENLSDKLKNMHSQTITLKDFLEHPEIYSINFKFKFKDTQEFPLELEDGTTVKYRWHLDIDNDTIFRANKS